MRLYLTWAHRDQWLIQPFIHWQAAIQWVPSMARGRRQSAVCSGHWLIQLCQCSCYRVLTRRSEKIEKYTSILNEFVLKPYGVKDEDIPKHGNKREYLNRFSEALLASIWKKRFWAYVTYFWCPAPTYTQPCISSRKVDTSYVPIPHQIIPIWRNNYYFNSSSEWSCLGQRHCDEFRYFPTHCMGMVGGKTRCTSKSCHHHQPSHVGQTVFDFLNVAAEKTASHPTNALQEDKLEFLRVDARESV